MRTRRTFAVMVSVLCAGVAAGLTGCSGGGLGGGRSVDPGLYGSDVVAPPGASARVEVIVIPPPDDKRYLDTNKHSVIFTHAGRTLAQGYPNDSGLVTIDLPIPPGPPPTRVEMVSDDNRLRGVLHIWALPPETPVALVPYRTFTAGAEELTVSTKGADKARHLAPGAAAGLSTVRGLGYIPIYFAPGSAYSVADSRQWLADHGMPDGPILTKGGRGGLIDNINPFRGSGLEEEIQPIRSLFRGTVIAFAEGYKEAKLLWSVNPSHVYATTDKLVSDPVDFTTKFPESRGRVTFAANWSELSTELTKAGRPSGGVPAPAGSPAPPPALPSGAPLPPPPLPPPSEPTP